MTIPSYRPILRFAGRVIGPPLSAFLFLTLFFVSVAGGEEPPVPSPLLQKGIQALQEERLDEALSIFQRVVQENPDSPQAHFYVGLVSHLTRRYAEAEAAFKKSLELDPTPLEPRLRLGIVYEETQRIPEAREAYQAVIQSAPGTPEGEAAIQRLRRIDVRLHFSRALELAREKKPQEALAELDVVIGIDSGNVEAHFARGEMSLLLKKREQAQGAYEKVVEFRPDHFRAHLRLGHLYEGRQEWEKARQAYEKVIALKRESPEAREASERLPEVARQIRIADLIREIFGLIEKVEKEAALQKVEELLALDPRNAMGYYYRGYVEDALEKNPEAIADLTRAVELAPTYLTARLKLGTVYQRIGEMEKAIALYQEVIAMGGPEDEDVKRAKDWLKGAESRIAQGAALKEAKAALEKGETAQGIESLEEATRLRPKSVETYAVLAGLYMKGGEKEKALETLRRGVARNPQSATIHLQLGALLKELDQLEEAKAELERVLSLGKETEEGVAAAKQLKMVAAKQHFAEANRQVAKGDFDAALREIQEVISLFPDDPSAYVSQGVFYDRLNRPEEAVQSFRKAIEMDPRYLNARLQLALALEGQGRFDEARGEYEAILPLNPDPRTLERVQSLLSTLDQRGVSYTRTKRARELYEAGKYQESLEETDALIALDPSQYLSYFFRGLSLVRLKRPLEAIAAYRKALELQPKALQARLELGRVYMDEGRYEEAQEAFGQVVREGEGTREGDFAAAALMRLRGLSYSLSYSQTMDSNIAQAGTPVQSVSSSLNGGINYILLRSKKGRLSVGETLSQAVYYKTQGVGNNLATALSGQYRLGESWFLSSGLNLTLGYFDRRKTSLSRGLSLSLSGGEGGIPTQVALRYGYSDALSYRSSSGDTARHSLSVSGLQQLSPKDQAGVTYTFVTSMNLDRTGSNFAYRSNGLSLTYNRQITKNLSGRLELSGTYFAYANPDSTQLFRRYRKTVQYGLSGGVSYPVSERVGFSLNYGYLVSATNLPLLSAAEQQDLIDILSSPIPTVGGDYERHSLSLNYSYAF